MSIKAIAFDIDGTLYPDAALRARVLPFALRHLRLLAVMASVRRALHARSAAAGGNGPMAADDGKPDDLASFRAMQAGLAAARLAIPVDRTAALIEACVYGELEDSFGHVPLYPGVRDCLESLRGAGLPLAVLSDFPVSKKLEALGLSAFFPIGRTSEECGRLKPAARPFLSLAKELGLEPQEILYVGNNRHFDIIGANAAGMETALRTSRFRSARLQASERKRDGNRGRAVDLSLPTFSFHRYEDLCSWILTQTMSRR